ncbi:MAG TPA: globin domain-containing protein [Amycolatopsis sp.]|uniref:globin domain-containing protein n=1 Tax=Amycolatopsis sp. TaxID=37632 RepID=UPI002B491465|nr:globin domain-containing protein [Amycolatopsis sp.]HKS45920.1 globin domain-containing protein [Amycolatopsis sp.]
MDTARLKASWDTVVGYGGQVPLFFYSALFLADPGTREMFPVSMAGQRDKLVSALGHVVSHVDDLDSAVGFLQQLGRDHRKFSVAAEHYPVVGQALLTTLKHFLGQEWIPDLAEDWGAAYKLVSDVMITAARDAAQVLPPWWEAEVVRHERRGVSVAVLTLRLDRPMPYAPGQSVSVETPLRPRVWRYYSPANPARDDGMIELHVRLVDGGTVSSALVQAVGTGDVLRVGPPVGSRLTLSHSQDVVLLCCGTGFAPFKALLGQIAQEGARRRAHLFLGARTAPDFYDTEAVKAFDRTLPQLTVVPTTLDDLRFQGARGHPADVALRYGHWPDAEFYLCGSPDMVTDGRDLLRAAGIGEHRIHFEDFTSQVGPALKTIARGDKDFLL